MSHAQEISYTSNTTSTPLTALVSSLGKALRADSGAALIPDATGTDLIFDCTWGTTQRELAGTRIAISSGIAGVVARTFRAETTFNPYKDSRFNPDVDISTGKKTQSLVTVPVVTQERLIAVLQFARYADTMGPRFPFSEGDKEAVAESSQVARDLLSYTSAQAEIELAHSFLPSYTRSELKTLSEAEQTKTLRTTTGAYLFADIVDSTAMLAHSKDSYLKEMQRMIEIVAKCDGDLLRDEGDAVVALFSGNSATAAAQRAAACAEQLAEAFRTRIRIGLSSGEVHKGLVRANAVRRIIPIGEAITAARRAQEQALPGTIEATSAFWKLLKIS